MRTALFLCLVTTLWLNCHACKLADGDIKSDIGSRQKCGGVKYETKPTKCKLEGGGSTSGCCGKRGSIGGGLGVEKCGRCDGKSYDGQSQGSACKRPAKRGERKINKY